MKKLFIVLTVLLTACQVDGWEINKAVGLCKEEGGVDYYSKKNMYVMCLSGKKHSVKSSPL